VTRVNLNDCEATTIAPNGLPPTVERWDGVRLEHEHADHPTYMFPVDAEFTGERPADLPEWDHSYCNERHALIYVDGCVALTLYEHCYALWNLESGNCLRGNSWHTQGWRITEASRAEIRLRGVCPVVYQQSGAQGEAGTKADSGEGS
jgi:hypothetical protein